MWSSAGPERCCDARWPLGRDQLRLGGSRARGVRPRGRPGRLFGAVQACARGAGGAAGSAHLTARRRRRRSWRNALRRHAWWCGDAPGRVIVLSDPDTGSRLRDRLHADARRFVHMAVHDASAELAAIGLLGRNADAVLARARSIRRVRRPSRGAPFAHGSIDGIPASWLLQSDRRALALVPREHAGEAWLAIERAGRPFGISCVGQEAVSRYALLERTRPAAFPHPLSPSSPPDGGAA